MEDNGSNGMCKACAASNGTVSKESPEEASVGDISETVDIKKETEIEDEFEDNFESDNLEYDTTDDVRPSSRSTECKTIKWKNVD